MISLHRKYMEAAFSQAEIAFNEGETPVGAVVVLNDEIIAVGHNRVEAEKNPLAHAEIIVLRQASERLSQKYLYGAALYCTLEPCILCAGAAVLYRVERIVFAAPDLRWGGCGTVFNIVDDSRLNHRIEIIGGIMETECGDLLKNFFSLKRGK